MTLILQSEEIKKIVHLNSELIPIIENAFKSLSRGETVMPPILRLDIKKFHGESDVKAAYIEGLDSFAIKVASSFFNNPSLGLPSSNGVMILLDSKTGILKSVLLDGGYLTDVRTAIAGAIASKYLSNPDIETAGIIGAGIQAKLQLRALMLVRSPKKIKVWARDPLKVKKFVQGFNNILNIESCLTTEELVTSSNLVISTTPSSSPLIKNEWLKKGMHITAMGSDAEHKNELDPKILSSCDVYVPDNQTQTSILGELHHALKDNLISPDTMFNDLGDIVLDPNLGRKSKEDITICDLTGTGVQDTAIARYAYNLAVKNYLGMKLD
jgi:ornithine cyclodeaminase